MSNERKRILGMLAEGKISVDEAERLLGAVGGEDRSPEATKARPRYLRVLVDGEGEKVNVRIPIQLLRSGIKLSSLIPGHAQAKVDRALGGKGFAMDLKKLGEADIDEFIQSLSELTVDVNDGAETVRVFCE